MTEKTLASKIEAIMQEYAASRMTPQVCTGKMPHDEFSAIVEKWQLSTGFLKVFLGKSEAAIQSYKYRKDHAITGPVATRIRQLDAVLESMRQQTP